MKTTMMSWNDLVGKNIRVESVDTSSCNVVELQCTVEGEKKIFQIEPEPVGFGMFFPSLYESDTLLADYPKYPLETEEETE